MTHRVDGPFPYHSPDGDAITASASDPEHHAGTLTQLANSLDEDERAIGSQVEGEITGEIQVNPREAGRTAGDLALAGQYAAGCLKMFGQAVTTHNNTVQSLNERYQSQVSAAQQDPERTPGDGSVTDARGAARAALQGEYEAAVIQLDTDAEEVAGLLKQGVNASNVLSLTAAGLMPMDASNGFSSLQAEMNKMLKEWFGAEFANIFGNNEDFPLISLVTAAGKMWRMSGGVAPIFQTGIVGRNLLRHMSRLPGPAGDFATWMKSAPRHMAMPNALTKPPVWAMRGGGGTAGWGPLSSSGKVYGMGAMRTLGVVGGVVNTGIGVHDLIQQGNPVEAFKRDGAAYVADVAETAFSASTTAFLVAPNPVTAGLAVGTGLVWAGAEVVDHWDEISETASDVQDEISETASDVWDGAGDVASDVGGTVKGWFS